MSASQVSNVKAANPRAFLIADPESREQTFVVCRLATPLSKLTRARARQIISYVGRRNALCACSEPLQSYCNNTRATLCRSSITQHRRQPVLLSLLGIVPCLKQDLLCSGSKVRVSRHFRPFFSATLPESPRHQGPVRHPRCFVLVYDCCRRPSTWALPVFISVSSPKPIPGFVVLAVVVFAVSCLQDWSSPYSIFTHTLTLHLFFFLLFSLIHRPHTLVRLYPNGMPFSPLPETTC